MEASTKNREGKSMRYFLFAVLCMFILSGCFAGVSDLNSASDEQLFNDLRLSGTVWQPLGHGNNVKAELRRRHPEYRWYLIDQRKSLQVCPKKKLFWRGAIQEK